MMREIITRLNRRTILKEEIRNSNSVIHGSSAMRSQMGFIFTRKPSDVDIFSKKPFTVAKRIEKRLDRDSGGNYYYTKPSKHKGTIKVKYAGRDGRMGTKDDETIMDITKMPNNIEVINNNGMRYRSIQDIYQSKVSTLSDKSKSYRHPKDMEDVKSIRTFRKIFKRG